MNARRTRRMTAIVSIAGLAVVGGVLLGAGTGDSAPTKSPAPAASSPAAVPVGASASDGELVIAASYEAARRMIELKTTSTTTVPQGGVDALWRLLVSLPTADRDALVAGLAPELRADLAKITEGVAAAVNGP